MSAVLFNVKKMAAARSEVKAQWEPVPASAFPRAGEWKPELAALHEALRHCANVAADFDCVRVTVPRGYLPAEFRKTAYIYAERLGLPISTRFKGGSLYIQRVPADHRRRRRA